MELWPGRPTPLGANWDGEGTNFAVFSENGVHVELCLFDDDGNQQIIDFTEVTNHVWHGYVPGVGPGQRYGFRVHGPFDPPNGHRFNPNKLLLDPYALAIEGRVDWDEACFQHRFDDELARNDMDSAPHVPRSVVVDRSFDWGDDRRPERPMHRTIVYEAHVKGLTMRCPHVPEALRGTYTGVAHPAVLEHLTSLGVTAIELLPVHQFVHDKFLVDQGRSNYWGYNSIGFFAPHNGYASAGQRGEQVREFKEMVKALHAAGLEVILDVVYNHTAEGNHLGPMLSLKGFDNAAYYRTVEDDKRYERTSAIIDHGDGRNYVVDLFTVAGGRTQDFIFHGPHQEFVHPVVLCTLTLLCGPVDVLLVSPEFKVWVYNSLSVVRIDVYL